jgi:hypothetical protein
MFWKKLAVVAGLTAAAGCHCGNGYRSAEYGTPPAEYGMPPAEYGMSPDGQVAVGVQGAEKGFVDRHPLFAAPRNYYRDSSDSFVVKVLAGTFVGVPVGIARESWQIVYGQ